MNQNQIVTDQWSNPESKDLYLQRWPDDLVSLRYYHDGRQCGGCSFYGAFDSDWGLCAFRESRHFLETVFEHFTCPKHIDEGWGPHSFTTDPECFCRCEGEALSSDGDDNDAT
jgi:hypothetical protein